MRVFPRVPSFAAIRMLMTPDENPGAPAGDPPAPAPAGSPPAPAPAPDAPPKPTMIGDAPVADGGGTPPAEGAKDGEPPKEPKKTPEEGAPAVPEKYELSLPENSPLDAQAIDRISSFAKENGLSQEQAAKVLENLNAEITSRDATYLESNRPGGAEWTAKTQAFQADALKDADIGGSLDNLQASVASATKVISKYFEPEVLAFLKETGFGAHKSIIKGFAKLARAVSEGGAPPRDPAPPSAPEKSRAQKLYPTLPSENSGVAK